MKRDILFIITIIIIFVLITCHCQPSGGIFDPTNIWVKFLYPNFVGDFYNFFNRNHRYKITTTGNKITNNVNLVLSMQESQPYIPYFDNQSYKLNIDTTGLADESVDLGVISKITYVPDPYSNETEIIKGESYHKLKKGSYSEAVPKVWDSLVKNLQNKKNVL